MNTEFDNVIKALTEAKPSLERVRATFLSFGNSIEKHAEQVRLKQQAIEEDSKRGSRLTKHRFSL